MHQQRIAFAAEIKAAVRDCDSIHLAKRIKRVSLAHEFAQNSKTF